MKAKIVRSNIEVDVQPYYQEGWFVGFTDTANPGLILYHPKDLVFPNASDWPFILAARDLIEAVERYITPKKGDKYVFRNEVLTKCNKLKKLLYGIDETTGKD